MLTDLLAPNHTNTVLPSHAQEPFSVLLPGPHLWGQIDALTRPTSRQQPWSTYAVHLTTLTAWALPNDILMVYLLWKTTESWPGNVRFWALVALGVWMWMTKWIKLLGHYIRYPVDVIFLPLSILFGYFHGLLKLYAMFTLDVVSSNFLVHFRRASFPACHWPHHPEEFGTRRTGQRFSLTSLATALSSSRVRLSAPPVHFSSVSLDLKLC